MLLELHTALQRLLYERGQIDPEEIDIQFEAPTRERIERILRPTINLFLYEILENLELRSNSYQTTRGNGIAEIRLPPRRFDFCYMISALTSEAEDEHLLLWHILTTLVRYSQVPTELLPEEWRSLAIPVVTKVCQAEESQRLLSIWSSLGVQPHPTLAYRVTVPIDIGKVKDVPLVLTRTARYRRGPESVEKKIQIGGVVRDKRGEKLAGVSVSVEGQAATSMTNSEGQFVLLHAPSHAVTLRITLANGESHAVTLAPSEGDEGEASTYRREIIL